MASVIAALSLALGIGANTAIFSLVSSVMLRSLPVKAPERLAILTSGPFASRAWTYAIWDELRQRQQLFDGAIAWVPIRFNLARVARCSWWMDRSSAATISVCSASLLS